MQALIAIMLYDVICLKWCMMLHEFHVHQLFQLTVCTYFHCCDWLLYVNPE